MSKSSAPQVIEVAVNFHGSGKVAIQSYGKETTEFGGSITKRYAIPEDWTPEQVDEFTSAQYDEIQSLVEEKLAPEWEAALSAQAEHYSE